MKNPRFVLLVLCGLLAGLPSAQAADQPGQTPGPPQEWFASASGVQLAQALVPAATRLAALRELGRRANETAGDGCSRIVVGDDAEPDTIVCPQKDGKDPLYVVLYKFLPSSSGLEEEGYPVARSAELFPPEPIQAGGPVAPPRPPLERRSELLITVFDAHGAVVTPFGGDNVLSDGVFADFTGSGRIARADAINFGVDGVKVAQVLVISAVEAPTARPLLTVLYNWGERASWSYEFASRKEDSTIEVRFGPVIDDEGKRIDPKVTYRWDAVGKAFVGPAGGKPGDHFLVLGKGKDLFDTVDTLKGNQPFFVETAPAPARDEPVEELLAASGPAPKPAVSATPTPPARTPVPDRFLTGLSDEAMLRFFEAGRNPTTDAIEAMRRQPTSITLPANFWDGPPREVALALADLNRSPAHRARYRLAVDDRDGATPPREGSLIFDTGSSVCYRSAGEINFLRFGPGDEPASLIYLGTVEAGMVFYNVVGSQPAYDLRWCALPAADARQLAAVLWWLDRVRSRARLSKDKNGFDRIMSTGDGHGTFQLVPDPTSTHPLRLSGTLWTGGSIDENPNPVAERWTGNYGPKTALNLTWHLVSEVLPARLGPEWSRFAPRDEPDIEFGVADQAPKYAADELIRLHDLAARALVISPQGQDRISYALLGGIVKMAGNLGFDDLAPALRKLAARLPATPPDRAGRTAETIQREMDAVDPYRPDREPLASQSPAEQAAREHWETLSHEREGVVNGTDEPGAAETLRGVIDAACAQLAKVRDPDALAASASAAKSPGALWALQQLRRLGETRRAAAVLEGWLKQADTGAARQIFAALTELAPERARQLADAVPAGESGHPLCVPAFSLLAKGGAVMPQEAVRRRALLAVVLDPKRDFSERADGINALVPDENPGRYPDPEIDGSLRRLLDEPALVTHNGYADDFLVSTASDALAKRGNGDDFDRILAHITGPSCADTMLEALARLLPRRGEEGQRKLEAFLRKQLTEKTNLSVGSLVYAAWLAGLRGLRPEVRTLATAGPEEAESARASRYGGDPAPLAGERFHVARQVAALWEDEASAITHVQALIAFGTHYDVTCDPERQERFKAELTPLAPALSTADRVALNAFLDQATRTMRTENAPAQTPDERPKQNTLSQLVRVTLGL